VTPEPAAVSGRRERLVNPDPERPIRRAADVFHPPRLS
jgi:hypothetical protein